MMHSRHPQTLFDRIEEAIDQIERSDAEVGFVVLGFKNIIPHEQYWPGADGSGHLGTEGYTAIIGVQALAARIREDCDAFLDEMVERVTPVHFDRLFAGKKAIPVVTYYADTITGSVETGRLAVAMVRMFDIYPRDGAQHLGADEGSLIGLLNHFAQEEAPN